MRSNATSHHFSYPIHLVPIPFYSSVTYIDYLTKIIPEARKTRSQTVLGLELEPDEGAMDVDVSSAPLRPQIQASIRSDGLLLYDAQAAYEHGTTPLSTWVPITSPQSSIIEGSSNTKYLNASREVDDRFGPLELFEK